MTVTVALEYEGQLLQALQKAAAPGTTNPLLGQMKSVLPALTAVTVTSGPTRQGIDLLVAIDAADATSTALIATSVGELKDNPDPFVDLLAEQGLRASTTDVGVDVQ